LKKIVFILSISFLFNSQTINNSLESDDVFNFLMGEYHTLSQEFYKANQYYSIVENNIDFESFSLCLAIAESNLEIGNFDKSLSFFLKSYHINKNNYDVIVLIYNLYNFLGYFDEAESFLIEASKHNRDNFYLLDNLFYHFLNNENYLESIEVLSDLYEITKDNIDFSHEILSFRAVELYDKCNNKELIFNILSHHYQTYNNFIFLKIEFIISKYINDFERMNYTYSILKSNNKADKNITILFCQSLFLKKDFDRIFKLLEPHYKDKKISFNALKLFFNSTVELNLENYSLEISKYAFNTYHNDPLSHEMYINALIDSKNFNEALKIIKVSKSDFSDYYTFDLLEAKLYEINYNYEDAIAIYNKIMMEHPNLVDVKYNAAKLHNALFNYDLCDSIFLELLDIDSNNIKFLNDFSMIIANRKSSSKEELNYAIGLIEYGLNIDKDNYKLLDTYGWINYKLGDYNKALDYINKSLFIKRDSMVLEHLIEVLKITNKFNQIEEIQSDFFDSK